MRLYFTVAEMKKKLKPCPFCGSSLYVTSTSRVFNNLKEFLPVIVCKHCGMFVAFSYLCLTGIDEEFDNKVCRNFKKEIIRIFNSRGYSIMQNIANLKEAKFETIND